MLHTPNDPKLRDRGARRGSCAEGLRGAGAVTCGAVLCSAWLCVRLESEKALKKSLETVVLAGDDRITGDEKLAPAERMEGRKDESRRGVETRAMTGDEKVARTGMVAAPRGSDAELAAGAEGEGSAGQDVGNSGQTGKRRGMGKLGVRGRWSWESCGFVLGVTVRERLTTPSSATPGRGRGGEHGGARRRRGLCRASWQAAQPVTEPVGLPPRS